MREEDLFSEHRGVPLAVPGALGDPSRGINRPGSQSPGVRESECPKWCQTHLGDSAHMPKWFENHRHSLHWLVNWLYGFPLFGATKRSDSNIAATAISPITGGICMDLLSHHKPIDSASQILQQASFNMGLPGFMASPWKKNHLDRFHHSYAGY